jgi:hypothetical protein
LRKKQSENNQLSKAIEDTRQVSQNLVENWWKIGSSLNTTDVLFPLKKEQELFIPRLSELYW